MLLNVPSIDVLLLTVLASRGRYSLCLNARLISSTGVWWGGEGEASEVFGPFFQNCAACESQDVDVGISPDGRRTLPASGSATVRGVERAVGMGPNAAIYLKTASRVAGPGRVERISTKRTAQPTHTPSIFVRGGPGITESNCKLFLHLLLLLLLQL